MKDKHKGTTASVLTDVLIIVLTCLVFIAGSSEVRYDVSAVALFKIFVVVLIYTIARILFIIMPDIMSLIVLLLLSLYCLSEISLGISQICGMRSSNHLLYSCTGSFNNPGPYGGFLAVCISLFAPCAFNKKTGTIGIIIGIIALIAVILLPSTQSRAALLALVLSLLIFTISKQKARRFNSRWWLLLPFIILIIIIGYHYKKPSADGRLFIDKICVKTMVDNKLKGVGIGFFGGAYGKSQATFFERQLSEHLHEDIDLTSINEHDRITSDCPANAFNEYLFLGVEVGFVAMLLFAAIIVSALIVAYKKDSIWCYGLITFSIFAFFSYPLHVFQFQVLFPIILAACLSGIDPVVMKKTKYQKRAIYKGKSRDLLILLPLLFFLSAQIAMRVSYFKESRQAERDWLIMENWYINGDYHHVIKSSAPLLPYLRHNSDFLFAYGQSLNKMGDYVKSDSILQMGTDISSDPMFWNVMGNNSLALGDYIEAEKRYKHAFYMVPNRLYPLYLLAKLYYTEGDTARFWDIVEKVETFIPKVESVNTEGMRYELRELKTSFNLEQE